MLLSQKKKKTWLCFGGKGSKVNCLFTRPLASRLTLTLRPFQSRDERAAGDGESVCGGAPVRPGGELVNHDVSHHSLGKMGCDSLSTNLQGYAAEMDNPAMAHLIPSTLLSKKDILFGNMSEIYQFHKRYTSLHRVIILVFCM